MEVLCTTLHIEHHPFNILQFHSKQCRHFPGKKTEKHHSQSPPGTKLAIRHCLQFELHVFPQQLAASGWPKGASRKVPHQGHIVWVVLPKTQWIVRKSWVGVEVAWLSQIGSGLLFRIKKRHVNLLVFVGTQDPKLPDLFSDNTAKKYEQDVQNTHHVCYIWWFPWSWRYPFIAGWFLSWKIPI